MEKRSTRSLTPSHFDPLKKSQNILIEDEGRRNQEALIAYFSDHSQFYE